DVVAQLHALIANEHARARNKLADLVLALAAEGTVEDFCAVATATGTLFSHAALPANRPLRGMAREYHRGAASPATQMASDGEECEGRRRRPGVSPAWRFRRSDARSPSR